MLLVGQTLRLRVVRVDTGEKVLLLVLRKKVLVLKQSLCLGLASEKFLRSWSCLGLAIQSLGLGLEISLIYTSGFLLRSDKVYVVSVVKVLRSC